MLSLGSGRRASTRRTSVFLIAWQYDLAGLAQPVTPLIVRWINQVVYWPLPIWVSGALYVLVLAYALAMLSLVPTRRLGSVAH